MKNFVAMFMVVTFALTIAVTSFAASSVTTTPKSTELLFAMTPSMTSAEVLYDNVNYIVNNGTTLSVYTSDWGMRSLKVTQASTVLIPKNIVPGDLRTVKYTYNCLTKKFTKVAASKK